MSIEENKRIMDRWLGEVWGKGRTELVLELAGLMYTRHEPEGNRVVRAEDYAKEIATRIEQAGGITEVERGGEPGGGYWRRRRRGARAKRTRQTAMRPTAMAAKAPRAPTTSANRPMPKVPKETRPNSAM